MYFLFYFVVWSMSFVLVSLSYDCPDLFHLWFASFPRLCYPLYNLSLVLCWCPVFDQFCNCSPWISPVSRLRDSASCFWQLLPVELLNLWTWYFCLVSSFCSWVHWHLDFTVQSGHNGHSKVRCFSKYLGELEVMLPILLGEFGLVNPDEMEEGVRLGDIIMQCR